MAGTRSAREQALTMVSRMIQKEKERAENEINIAITLERSQSIPMTMVSRMIQKENERAENEINIVITLERSQSIPMLSSWDLSFLLFPTPGKDCSGTGTMRPF